MDLHPHGQAAQTVLVFLGFPGFQRCLPSLWAHRSCVGTRRNIHDMSGKCSDQPSTQIFPPSCKKLPSEVTSCSRFSFSSLSSCSWSLADTTSKIPGRSLISTRTVPNFPKTPVELLGFSVFSHQVAKSNQKGLAAMERSSKSIRKGWNSFKVLLRFKGSPGWGGAAQDPGYSGEKGQQTPLRAGREGSQCSKGDGNHGKMLGMRDKHGMPAQMR